MRPYVQFVNSDGGVSEIFRIVGDGTLIAITSKQSARLKIRPFRIEIGDYTGVVLDHILFSSLVSDCIPPQVLYKNKTIGEIVRPGDPRLNNFSKLLDDQVKLGNRMFRFFFKVVRSAGFCHGTMTEFLEQHRIGSINLAGNRHKPPKTNL